MGVERVPTQGGASFSAAVVIAGPGRWVHISGQIEPRSTLAEEAAACFEQIAATLAPLGGSLSDVVRITAYLTSLDEYAEYGRVRAQYFGDTLPASAAVQVAGLLSGAKIEIDGVAFLADESADGASA